MSGSSYKSPEESKIDDDGSGNSSRDATGFHPARRLQSFLAPTVWHVFTPMAADYKAINLGQGFPGWCPPSFVTKALSDSTLGLGRTDSLSNQYCRSAGAPPLCRELAKEYAVSLGREAIDPMKEVLVTNGCSEALYLAMTGLLDPGDEVILFEPAFDLYAAQAEMAGASCRFVPLIPPEEGHKTGWSFDAEALRGAFTAKTRMILLNHPHNPTGKIFSAAELQLIAAEVKKHSNVVVVSDEVYEHMVFGEGKKHVSIATLPGMWDRTVVLSSAGKTFSVTGWKIGWAIGPAHLVRCLAVAHQWVVFSVHTPAQHAIASALHVARHPYEGKDSYYAWLKDEYLRKKQLLETGLRAAGLPPISPEGGFFVMARTESVLPLLPKRFLDEDIPTDWKICKWLCQDIGVAAIPPSSFCSNETKDSMQHLARFAFCKPDAVLQQAADRLARIPKLVAAAAAATAKQ